MEEWQHLLPWEKEGETVLIFVSIVKKEEGEKMDKWMEEEEEGVDDAAYNNK